MTVCLPVRARLDLPLRFSYLLVNLSHYPVCFYAPRRRLLEWLPLARAPSSTLRQLFYLFLAHLVCDKICELAVKFLIALLIFKEHPECQTEIVDPVAAEGQL